MALQSKLNMANEEYLLVNGKKPTSSLSRALGIASLLALISAVIIGIVISTQVARLPKAAKGSADFYQDPANPDWAVRATFNMPKY